MQKTSTYSFHTIVNKRSRWKAQATASNKSISEQVICSETDCSQVVEWMITRLANSVVPKRIKEENTWDHQIRLATFHRLLQEFGFSANDGRLLCHMMQRTLGYKSRAVTWRIQLSYWLRLSVSNLSEVQFGYLFFQGPAAHIKPLTASRLTSCQLESRDLKLLLACYFSNSIEKLVSLAAVGDAFHDFAATRSCAELFSCYRELFEKLSHPVRTVPDRWLSSFVEKFVKPGAPCEVNISWELKRSLLEVSSASSFTTLVGLLKEMQHELKSLIEFNTINDFINSDASQQRIIDQLFHDLGVTATGTLPLPLFKKWTRRNPELLQYFKTLKMLLKHLYQSALYGRERQDMDGITPDAQEGLLTVVLC